MHSVVNGLTVGVRCRSSSLFQACRQQLLEMMSNRLVDEFIWSSWYQLTFPCRLLQCRCEMSDVWSESSVRCKLGICLWLLSSSWMWAMQGQGGACMWAPVCLLSLSGPSSLVPAVACWDACWAFTTPAPLFFCSEIMSALTWCFAAAPSAASLVTWKQNRKERGRRAGEKPEYVLPRSIDQAANATMQVSSPTVVKRVKPVVVYMGEIL